MTDCDLSYTDQAGVFVCRRCGQPHRALPGQAPEGVARNCGAAPPRRKKRSCGGCRSRRELPPWSVRAWNFAVHSIEWLRHGTRRVSADEFDRRMATCRRCPDGQLMHTPRGERCVACGCWLRLKAARNTHPGYSDCPLGHWDPITD